MVGRGARRNGRQGDIQHPFQKKGHGTVEGRGFPDKQLGRQRFQHSRETVLIGKAHDRLGRETAGGQDGGQQQK